MSDDALDETLKAFNSMTSYLNIDDMLFSLGYTNKEDFINRSGLQVDEAERLYQSWEQTFIDAN